MRMVIFFIRNILLLMFMLFVESGFAKNRMTEITLTGSTPGDKSIRKMFSIPTEVKVDFIRWNLRLYDKSAFELEIAYGESKPNTLDFKREDKQSIKGTYLIAKNQGENQFKEIYQLKSDDLAEIISIVKINERLFHILTGQSNLMIGNGGWSYTLNRKAPIEPGEILISSKEPDGRSLQLVYAGRTPCQEFAREHPAMKVGPTCFKLKWKLVLNRDPATYLPTTCTLRTIVNNGLREIKGSWTIDKGTHPEAIIIKIQTENLSEPILLLMGDENVLFFLDRNYNLLIGNEDFSFVVNKVVP
ncbi:hypothetical protein [Dyadobacter tibetensis]|uniref:hypothetical protein n=1 Tax=Dyadobacter tibetensis TaxID=1211851 RepID=UPI0004B7A4F0|nr:hypothetical protein [Dyadobacter tibetensis]